MNLLIVGVNHNTAPIAIREKVAFNPEQIGSALQALQSSQGLEEIAILSTCNRTEIYAIADSDKAASGVVGWLTDFHQLPADALSDCTYDYFGPTAVKHVMRVAAGLDSMVLGEPQILGQLKDSFATADSHQVMGKQLGRLAQTTYRVAKQVRSETAIGQSTVSVASTAVDLAAQLFTDLASCRALLLGAGDTTLLVAQHLRGAGVQDIVIANRTVENAERLAAELGNATATGLNDIANQLINADIVIASTASQLPIVGKGMAERAIKLRRHKPIFMVDLAVPRDIEPEVNKLRDVYLYSVDDLQQIIEENLSSRQEAASEAETLIDTALEAFEKADKTLEVVDSLVAFRQKHEAIKQSELEKSLKRLEKGDDPAEVLKSLANQLTNKIIHTPSVQLKQAKADGRDDIILAIEEIFNINGNSED